MLGKARHSISLRGMESSSGYHPFAYSLQQNRRGAVLLIIPLLKDKSLTSDRAEKHG
jgi:hypothetical protein